VAKKTILIQRLLDDRKNDLTILPKNVKIISDFRLLTLTDTPLNFTKTGTGGGCPPEIKRLNLFLSFLIVVIF
jgi:hypothetical protein